jgi:arsenate reductase-like glutaredoxin family protein
MKRVASLTLDDFAAGAQYHIITDINAMPLKQIELIQRLNADEMQWRDITRASQAKIREYATDQGENLPASTLEHMGYWKLPLLTIDCAISNESIDNVTC